MKKFTFISRTFTLSSKRFRCWRQFVSTLFIAASLLLNFTLTAQELPGVPEPTLVIVIITDLEVSSCIPQDQVNSAYTTWFSGLSITGGCDLVPNIVNPGAPDACGGSATVTWNPTSSCGVTISGSATFTVAVPPDMIVVPITDNTVDSCMTQDQVNSAYTTWFNGLSITGGCDLVPNIVNPGAPDACGGSATVTWNATSSCEDAIPGEATFTVTVAPDVVVVPIISTTVDACLTQAEVDADYLEWFNGLSITGGCDLVPNIVNPGAPDACGGSATVTWNATSSCEDAILGEATFTVTVAPDVVVVPIINTTVDACLTQAEVDADYLEWFNGLSITGGCNLVPNIVNPGAPDACGGSATVTWNATSSCEDAIPGEATFTVTVAPDVVVVPIINTTVDACLTQAEVDADYLEWFNGLSITGGCDLVPNIVNPGAPDACGGSATVTWNATSSCEDAIPGEATFTVIVANTLVVNDVQDFLTLACTYGTQEALDAAFALWLEEFTEYGGCDPQGVFADTYTAPDKVTGGFVDVIYNVTDLCDEGNSTARFTVEPCITQICSYTQGYYGNSGGTSCDGETEYSTYYLIEKALNSYGGTMTIGLAGHAVLISTSEVIEVIEYLPGGKLIGELKVGDIGISDDLFKNLYTRKVGKKYVIDNKLLAQTIVLGLNLGINNTLADFALQTGTFATASIDGDCGSSIAKVRSCNTETGIVSNEYEYYTIKSNIAENVTNVSELFTLANRALGNSDGIVNSEDGVSLIDIHDAVDRINNAFDGCRIFIGYGIEKLTCSIIAPTFDAQVLVNEVITDKPLVVNSFVDYKIYPVPFESVITVKYKFDYNTDVNIQIFNMQGSLVYGMTNNQYFKSEFGSHEISLSRTYDQTLIVRITTNKENLSKTIVAKSSKHR